MNRRQKIKNLKKQNKFMYDVINNTGELKRLYKAYNQPIPVVYEKLNEYRIVKDFAVPNKLEGDELRKFMAKQIAKDLQSVIEDYMQLEDYGNGSALEFREAKEVKASFNLWLRGKK